jgi:branched-chain amino acid transport system substrate-binding protein
MRIMRAWIGVVVAAFGSPAVAAQTTGASTPILIGQSAGFTGGQAEYSKDIKSGIDAYFAAVNKSGGVNGRQLKLLSEDDKGKKENVVANTKKLIETDNVFALIGYTSGAGVEAALSYLDSAKVPMLSPATGNMGIRATFHRYLFHTRAGYDEEMKKIVTTLATIGMTRFALAYLDDVGPANAKAMHDALAEHNLKAVAAVGLNRNATDFSVQIDTLMKAQPAAVLFITNGNPITKIVQGMKQRGYTGQFVTSSFSGFKFIDDLKQDSHGVIVSQVLPPPHRRDIKITKEFQQHFKEAMPDLKPNYTSLEGYIAARVLVEAIKRAGADPTRERFIDALENMKSLDLGGYEINYSRQDHGGARFVDTGIVSSSGTLTF